jgi:uroporphyrinogen-III synthase
MADLHGKTIALPETRQLDVLAALFENRGARVLRCPMVAIRDAPDSRPVLAWIERVIAGGCDDVILLTGEGLRRLLGFAERAGRREAFIAALARTRRITRGPKPVRALREIGLEADLPARAPTTEGVIETLSGESLAGRRVGLQLYGTDPNARLQDFLRTAGALCDPVAPYVYAAEADEDQVRDLIMRLVAGAVDLIAFTSAPQVRRVFEVAGRQGMEEALRHGLAQTGIAAIGPVVADQLQSFGIRTDIMPKRAFAMRPLVNEILAASGQA